MARPVALTPYEDARTGSWVVNVPPSLSPTGKRKREFFRVRKDAEARAQQLKAARIAGSRVARGAAPDLIRAAVEYDEVFRTLYGFPGGLKEACDSFIQHLEATNSSLSFGDLLKRYEEARSVNWSGKYATTWRWFRGLVAELEERPILTMGTDHWVAWLEERARREGWKERTFNDVASMLSSVWNAALKQGQVERNPMDGVPRRRLRRKAKPVYTVPEVHALMECAWEHDRELVPYFALAIFAGLRPDEDSEITSLEWGDVNLDEGWIRVAANFDNKTGTKRFVPMEANLKRWLEPWRDSSGPVVPKNLRARRRWLTRGRYQSPAGTPASRWTPLVPFGSEVRDITRHTYGSYLEAKYRDRNKVKEAMGHADFTTYEQHYRNARSPREAEAFWSIVPPSSASLRPEGTDC